MKLYTERVDEFLQSCYLAGIRDPVRFIESKMAQNYGYLRGAFPRNILPTDVDGEVELSGNILRFEFKHEGALREGRIPAGQMRYLKLLVERYGFTVFLVGLNEFGEPTIAHMYAKGDAGIRFKVKELPRGRMDLRELCCRWSKKQEPNFITPDFRTTNPVAAGIGDLRNGQ